MQLYRQAEIPAFFASHVFRESSSSLFVFGSLLALCVGASAVYGIPFAISQAGILRVALLVLGGIFLSPLVLGAGLLLSAFVASRKSANWLLRYGPDGFLIKFRSYQNAHLPDATPTVVWIPGSEVARIRSISTAYERRSDDGLRSVVNTSIDLLLRKPATEELRRAIELEKQLPPAGRFVGTRAHHAPVGVPEPGVVRLSWAGRNGHIRPGVRRALAIFGERHCIESGVTQELDFGAMNDAERETRLIELVESGDVIGATALAREHYGMDLTRARAFVDALAGRDSRSPDGDAARLGLHSDNG